MAIIIDGKKIAAEIETQVAKDVKTIGLPINLHVILVGKNPASTIYVDNKQKACGRVGINSHVHKLSESETTESIIKLIGSLNADEHVHGILVQMPLPQHVDRIKVIEAVSPYMDVDGLHPVNLGRLIYGKNILKPCTPQGILHLIKSIEPNLSGLNAVVIGRSSLVGLPTAKMLLQENASVTTLHSKSKNIKTFLQNADIIVAAAGVLGLLKAEYVSDHAIVIDVGINRLPSGQIVGDVDFEALSQKVKAITPVPGGVGPMTIAYLLKNTVNAFNSCVSRFERA